MNNGRITQEAIEVLGIPASTNARITQQAVEALLIPTGTMARITQQAIEVLYLPVQTPGGLPPARSSATSFAYFPLRPQISKV
jgi:hypothetical protein